MVCVWRSGLARHGQPWGPCALQRCCLELPSADCSSSGLGRLPFPLSRPQVSCSQSDLIGLARDLVVSGRAATFVQQLQAQLSRCTLEASESWEP